MKRHRDFRAAAFETQRVEAAGKALGRREYWRFYAIENILRVVIHSVLAVQVHYNWWGVAVNQDIQNTVSRVTKDYARQPDHTNPGRHEIYYVFLRDLIEILRVNRHLFQPAMGDVDGWLVRLERIRLSRNIVGHMNWLKKRDTRRIERLHGSMRGLVDRIEDSGITLQIP